MKQATKTPRRTRAIFKLDFSSPEALWVTFLYLDECDYMWHHAAIDTYPTVIINGEEFVQGDYVCHDENGWRGITAREFEEDFE